VSRTAYTCHTYLPATHGTVKHTYGTHSKAQSVIYRVMTVKDTHSNRFKLACRQQCRKTAGTRATYWRRTWPCTLGGSPGPWSKPATACGRPQRPPLRSTASPPLPSNLYHYSSIMGHAVMIALSTVFTTQKLQQWTYCQDDVADKFILR